MWQKLRAEVRAVALVTLYFAAWIGTLMVIKVLVLEEYHIQYHGFSLVLVGALVLAKVVLVLEHVSLGAWIQIRPAWVHVAVRTVLYSFGVLIVLLLEKAFESRHDHGGFLPALASLFQHVDIHHVWVNAIVLSGALLVYNAMEVVRLRLGEGGLSRLFLSPLPNESHAGHDDTPGGLAG